MISNFFQRRSDGNKNDVGGTNSNNNNNSNDVEKNSNSNVEKNSINVNVNVTNNNKRQFSVWNIRPPFPETHREVSLQLCNGGCFSCLFARAIEPNEMCIANAN
mmetsp:Transcript_19900/g.55439  ORF Transcript_19900/g.55439 Transcript_19900/m.55439 type:complete len:104 (+) Transcript_19900:1514-1825(+)